MITVNVFKVGQKIKITDSSNVSRIETVMKIIDMKDGDFEILIDRKENRFFSIDYFNQGKSWAKKIEFIPTYEELESQLAKKDEIIKELKEYSDFLSQYSDCDDSCSWARHSSRCKTVTRKMLDHKKKIEWLENGK